MAQPVARGASAGARRTLLGLTRPSANTQVHARAAGSSCERRGCPSVGAPNARPTLAVTRGVPRRLASCLPLPHTRCPNIVRAEAPQTLEHSRPPRPRGHSPKIDGAAALFIATPLTRAATHRIKLGHDLSHQRATP